MKIASDFQRFRSPRPQFLQYITVNLKVFAYCSESLRGRFRSVQDASKMLKNGLPGVPLGAFERPLELQVAPQKSLRGTQSVQKNFQVIPKRLPRSLQGTSRRTRRAPMDTQGVPQGPQRVPKGPPGIPKECPRGPQGVSKGSQGVPKRSPRGPQEVPKGCPKDPQGSDREAPLNKGSVE